MAEKPPPSVGHNVEDADLVFEKNLICCEEDVEFHSLAVNMNPLMGPDLLKRQKGGQQACSHTRTHTHRVILQMYRQDKHTIFLLLMSPR